jgi:hypothetical protein
MTAEKSTAEPKRLTASHQWHTNHEFPDPLGQAGSATRAVSTPSQQRGQCQGELGFAIWTTFEAMSIRFWASGEKLTLA